MDAEAELQKLLVQNLNRAGAFLVSEIRQNLNVSQPYKRSGSNFRGLDPSSPGQFPKKLSGQLIKSIAWNVDEKNLVLTVGTAMKHGKYLEFGTAKMAAREWLYRTVDANRSPLNTILSRSA